MSTRQNAIALAICWPDVRCGRQNARDVKSLQAFAVDPGTAELQTLPTGWRLLLVQSNVWATAQLKHLEVCHSPAHELHAEPHCIAALFTVR